MAFTMSNEGEAFLLNQMCGKVAAVNLRVHLIKAAMTVAQTDQYSTYSANLADFTGYASAALSTASWTVSAGSGTGTALANKAQASYAEQTFTMGTPGTTNTIYGYIITDTSNTTLIGAEAFTSSKAMLVNGDAIKITPILTLGTE